MPAIVEAPAVAKKPDEYRDRFDLRIDPALMARLAAQAERFGQGNSAYVRLAIIEKLERDEASDPRLNRKK
jgi:predicted HicB family RNase H-like nuclease